MDIGHGFRAARSPQVALKSMGDPVLVLMCIIPRSTTAYIPVRQSFLACVFRLVVGGSF